MRYITILKGIHGRFGGVFTCLILSFMTAKESHVPPHVGR